MLKNLIKEIETRLNEIELYRDNTEYQILEKVLKSIKKEESDHDTIVCLANLMAGGDNEYIKDKSDDEIFEYVGNQLDSIRGSVETELIDRTEWIKD